MEGSNGLDTHELLKRARAGDASAAEQLLARHRERLLKMVAGRIDPRVSARVDPSDVVQEALADASRRLPHYLQQSQRPFYLWLRQIAWDRLVDLHRRHVHAEMRSVLREEHGQLGLSDASVSQLADELAGSSGKPDRRMVRKEMHNRVRAALDQLSAQHRELLILRHLEQLNVAEIADILGISQTAVTTRHLRALERLRGILGDDFGRAER